MAKNTKEACDERVNQISKDILKIKCDDKEKC